MDPVSNGDNTFPHFVETYSPALFQKALSEASAAHPHGASVDVHPVEQYASHRLFLTPDAKAGYAVSPSGELVSGFKHPDSSYENVGRRIVEHGILVGGGTHGNAYDPVLPKIYSKAIARIPWNPDYAPDNWKGGTPDIVFMAADVNGKPNVYRKNQGKEITGDNAYEKALGTAAYIGNQAKAKRQAFVEDARRRAGIPEGKYSPERNEESK
jgi:hypothetical protein